MNIFDLYLDKIITLIKRLKKEGSLELPVSLSGINVDIPPANFDCDISTNVSMVLSKINKKLPTDIANQLISLIKKEDSNIESITVDLGSVESEIDLIYREILHRPADSNGLDIFSSQITANQLTYDELREILYQSEEYSLIVKPSERIGLDEIQDDTKKLINKLYVDILYREADIPSLLQWGSLLESEKITINEIEEILLNSDEKKSLLTPDQRKKFSELKDETRILLEETYQEILLRHADIGATELYGSLLEANKITIEEIRQILYESDEYLYSPYIINKDCKWDLKKSICKMQ